MEMKKEVRKLYSQEGGGERERERKRGRGEKNRKKRKRKRKNRKIREEWKNDKMTPRPKIRPEFWKRRAAPSWGHASTKDSL